MQRTKPPFRADKVGSLLRPQPLKDARAKHQKGEISADDLRKVEDIEIEKVVHKQEEIGLKLVTDGEFRRSWWHFDFLEQARPAVNCTPRLGHPVHGRRGPGRCAARHRQARLPRDHPMLEHFRFLKNSRHRAVTPKMTIPSPACCTSAAAAR